jgi:hypothetical protein
MDIPYCEMCGEEHATLQVDEAAVCDNCFAGVVREDLKLTLGREVCAQPLRSGHGLLSCCLEPYGSDHSHNSTQAA